MRRITLSRAVISYFKSFVGPVTVNFTTGPGLKYLTGDNQVEPRLEANGAGKSSLLDAIFWCWYGYSLKGLRASDLLNWNSAKERPGVETIVDIDGVTHTIGRLGSPEVIVIDDKPATQTDVDNLLGLSRNRARHVLFFGQNVKFFCDLDLPERGKLLDEVLDLSIWYDASVETKLELDRIEERIKRADLDIAACEGKLVGLGNPDEVEALAEEWEATRVAADNARKTRRKELRAVIGELDTKIATLEKRKAKYDLDGLTAAKKKLSKLNGEFQDANMSATKHATLSARARDDLEHMQANPDCPTCGQKFPKTKRDAELSKLRALETKHADLRKEWQAGADDLGDQLTALRDEVEVTEKAARKAIVELAEAKAECRVALGAIEALAADDTEVNPYILQLERMGDRETITKKELKRHRRIRLAQEEAAERTKYWRDGFKRVRLFRIKQVLKHLELEVEAMASSLGLDGWKITFHTETETKGGSLRQGVQIRVRNLTTEAAWESWSGGEAQRVRVAIARGFSRMVQHMAGIEFTMEFWDEPSTSLSAAGILDLVDTLRHISVSEKLSVWLVDHGLTDSVFDEEWVAIRGMDGTEIWKV